MQKGISTIIATLLLLVITVALITVAFNYIFGIFETQTSGIVELADVSCNVGTGQFFGVVRNLDQLNNVSAGEITVSLNDVPLGSGVLAWSDDPIRANGGRSVVTISGQSPTAGQIYTIKVLGPAGRAQKLPIGC